MASIRTIESFFPAIDINAVSDVQMPDFATALKTWQDIQNKWDTNEKLELENEASKKKQDLDDLRQKKMIEYTQSIDPTFLDSDTLMKDLFKIASDAGDYSNALDIAKAMANKKEAEDKKKSTSGSGKMTKEEKSRELQHKYLRENGNDPFAAGQALLADGYVSEANRLFDSVSKQNTASGKNNAGSAFLSALSAPVSNVKKVSIDAEKIPSDKVIVKTASMAKKKPGNYRNKVTGETLKVVEG